MRSIPSTLRDPLAVLATAGFAVAGLLAAGIVALGPVGCRTVSTPSDARSSPAALGLSDPAGVGTAPRTVDPVVEPWDFGGKRGECIDLGTHRVHSTLVDPVIRERIQVFLPTALDHYRSAILPLPEAPGPINIFLFGSRGDWLAFTRLRLPEEASMYEQIGRGGYTIEGDAVLYDIGRWDTFTIAAHEGWHAYSQRVLRHSLPVWLEEGIACYMEGVKGGVDGGPPTFLPWRNFERFGELRDTVRRDRVLPLGELIVGTPQDFLASGRGTLLGYYAQVWALVHFLVEGEGGRYRPGLERLLRDAVEGRISSTLWQSTKAGSRGERRMAIGRLVGPAVMREYIDEDLDRLAAEYDAFVRGVARRGNGERIWRGERPETDPGVPVDSPMRPRPRGG